MTKKRMALRRVSLTEAAVKRLEPPAKGREYHYDTRTTGLAICVTSAGAKVFYWYRTVNRQPVRMQIGAWPGMSVDSARKQAAKHNNDHANGINPLDARRVARSVATFGELFAHYLENHAKVHKKSWPYDQQQYDRYLALWKSRRITSITRADVKALHKRIGEKSGVYAANRLMSLIHKMFVTAKDIGFDKENPADGVQRFKEKSRERFLQGDELPRFFEALKAEPNATIRDYFFLSLLTGARRGNMLRMQWNEVSISRGVWSVPDSKSGDPLSIVLPPAALEVLRRRKADNDASDNPSVWVFPGHIHGSHLTTAQRNWTELCKRGNLQDVRIHDLRRTLGSWQAAAGTSLAIIGKSLGHKNVATTQIYARLNLDPVQVAVGLAVDAMLATIPKEKEGAKEGAKEASKKTVKETKS